jgi:uncharacterized protein YndB with AHSA1/START domain
MSTDKLEIQTLDYGKETQIAAPIDIAWEALLAELGPEGTMPGKENQPFPFVLEAWPGGRWYRDLGNNNGHFWAHVQVIKPPALLELCGPMFASYPASNHVQYRLKENGDATTLTFKHRAHGFLPVDMLKGVDQGWSHWLKRIEEIAQRMKKERQTV